MRTVGYACATTVLALAIAAPVFAQPPQTPPGQAKRAPHQTPDRGDSDATRELTPAEESTVQRQFGKNPSGVVITTLPDGTVAAQLDESYMETMTVKRAADGSLEFGHASGVQKASRVAKAVRAPSGSKAKATTKKAVSQKAAKPPLADPLPAPKLEEKE